LVLRRPGPGRERIAVGFDTAAADDNDGVRTELGHGVMLGFLAERNESKVHTLGRADAKIGPRGAARLHSGGTAELLLGLDPLVANAEGVRFPVPPIGKELPIADNDVLERPDRRKLSVEPLAFGEERQIESRFHAGEA
jgi:hypothetical protein